MNHPLSHKHSHHFQSQSQQNSKKVALVFFLTLATMVVEIGVGAWSGSMALLADGWHMGTHAAAFAITLFTYHYATQHKDDASFSFGTGKVQPLGGFASAVALAVVAFLMAIESLERLLNPQDIFFGEAIGVAIIGLIVNVASVFILHDGHHEHHDGEHHHDHNLKAAYFHVLADTLTSILAIVALCAGRFFGWIWLDAVMGIVGAVIISKWALALIVQSSHILLDRTDIDTVSLKENLEANYPVIVHDLHIWPLAENHRAVILAIEGEAEDIDLTELKEDLASKIPNLAHATVELSRPDSSNTIIA